MCLPLVADLLAVDIVRLVESGLDYNLIQDIPLLYDACKCHLKFFLLI